MNMKKRYRKLYYQVSAWFEKKELIQPSDELIDVIIPVVEKDLQILPLCLEGIRNCVSNPIQAIYLVSPVSSVIQEFCKKYELIFVDECSILGYGPREINYLVNNTCNRSGWIFQQLIKLSGAIGTSAHFLVMDSDHILIRPHTFVAAGGDSVFYLSREFHQPYYKTMSELLGHTYGNNLSYVAHKMIFSRQVLNELRQEIVRITGKEWDQAILSKLDPTEISCFSEFETYGNYFPNDRKKTLLFRNKTLTYSSLSTWPELQARFSHHYRAVTFPDYKNH